MIVFLCAALSGAMFYLSQGIDNVWALAWLAPAPLLWLAYGEARGGQLFVASLVAYAAGQIYFFQAYGTLLLTTELGFMLVNGALLVEGPPGEVARDPRVKAVYLGEAADV